MEDIIEPEVDSTSETTTQVEAEAETEVEPTVEAEQDPLKTELDRVQKKEVRTELEKAQFSLKKNAERVQALGGDYRELLGVDQIVTEETTDDDTPLTVGMLKKFQQENASKTALQSAEEISNETERELVKYHLQNTIKSTGNPAEDLKLARGLVNSIKNSQIIEEVSRRPQAKTHSSASGVDANQEKEIVLTPDEQQMMKIAGLSVKEILQARAGKQFDFKK